MSFFSYLQAMAVETLEQAGADIHTVALAFTGFALTMFWREIHAFKRSVEKWQSRIDTTLFGPEGNNGLNGTSKDHEVRIRVLEAKE